MAKNYNLNLELSSIDYLLYKADRQQDKNDFNSLVDQIFDKGTDFVNQVIKKSLCTFYVFTGYTLALSNFLKEVQNRGVDLNQFNINQDLLVLNYDNLLNHPTNPVNKEWFFGKAINSYTYNEEGYQTQSKFIELALDYGMDITKIDGLYPGLEFLSRNQDILLNHSTNPVNKEWFFKKALSYYASDSSDEKGYQTQSKFLKLALDYGVDITKIDGVYLSQELLLRNQDILLNHSTNPVNKEWFFKKALSHYSSDEKGYQTQSKFLKLALDYGVNITKIDGVYLSEELLLRNQEILLNHSINLTNPNILLKLALTSNSNNLSYKFAEKAIELGANVNQEIDSGMGMISLLDSANNRNPHLKELFKKHGATCGIASKSYELYLEKHPLLKSFLNDPSDQRDISSENLNAPKEYFNKIPYLVHHVWLTHSSTPREMSDADIENTILTKNTFGDNVSKWNHIIWTNNKNLIPKSVKALEENGIEVRDISEYKDEFSLYDTVTALADKKLWGMASDALRYEIVAKFGGIYSDLNFEFIRPIENELFKYDFIAQDFINYFFAAKPNHPTLNSLVETIKEHFNDPSTYLTNFSEIHTFDKTVFFSLLPFTTAIIENYNQDNNSDIVLGLTNSSDYSETYNSYLDPLEYLYYNTENYYYHYHSECPSYWETLNKAFNFGNLRIGIDGYKNAHLTWIEEDNSTFEQGYSGNSTNYYYSNIA